MRTKPALNCETRTNQELEDYKAEAGAEGEGGVEEPEGGGGHRLEKAADPAHHAVAGEKGQIIKADDSGVDRFRRDPREEGEAHQLDGLWKTPCASVSEMGNCEAARTLGLILPIKICEREEFAARTRPRVEDAYDLADLLLDMLDRKHQVGVVRDDHRDIAVAAVGVDEEITREIHIRTFLFGFQDFDCA